MRVLFALLALAATVSAQGLTGPNFYITNGDNNDYTFSIDGTPVKDPALNLTVGTTYKFFLNLSMSAHPFGFSTLGDPNVAPAIEDFSSASKGSVTISGACTAAQNSAFAWYTTSAANETTNPCIISITPPASIAGLAVYYRCSVHAAMVGSLSAVGGGSGVTTAPPTSGGTTPSPTTATPTQPTSSSTGKNGAAAIVPGAAAFVIAAINVIFSA